jgi:hypothetical protein
MNILILLFMLIKNQAFFLLQAGLKVRRPPCFVNFSSQKVQYFDYQATTPIDYRVTDAMMPYLT